MSFDNIGWNPLTDNPNTGFVPVPEGVYRLSVVKVEDKLNSAKDGNFLSLRYEIIDGKYKGRVIFDCWNYRNKSAATMDMAKASWAAFHRSCGSAEILKVAQMQGKIVTAKVIVDSSRNPPENKIKRYLYGDEIEKELAKAAKGGEEPPF